MGLPTSTTCCNVSPLCCCPLLLQLIELLAVPKGPLLGQLTAAVLEWQMAHPKGSKEDCVEHIKACYSKLQGEAGSKPARGKK